MIILHYIISLTLPFIDQYPNIIIRQYILKQEMHKHNSTDNELDDSEYQTDKASVQLKLLKIKSVSRQYKHQFRKQIFGDHYNHSKVNLNKQKKYLLQEEKNTEIQRSNRMLLEKIQQIAKRSIPFSQRKRIFTQHQDQGQRQESQQNKALIKQLKSTDSEHYSQNNLTKIGEKSKNTKVYKKNLFKVSKQIENKLYQVSAQLQNNKYILSLSNNKQTQYIKISCRHYRSIYKQILQYNHLNILPFLQIKQGQFTLCGIDKKLIIIEQISSSKSLLPKIFLKELSQSKINKEI